MKKNIIKTGEVWLVNFTYEEDNTISKSRPVIVLSESSSDFTVANICEATYLSVKVTSHTKRNYDDYDTVIVKWREANLVKESIARVSKTMNIPISDFKHKIGDLDNEDFEKVIDTFLHYSDNNK